MVAKTLGLVGDPSGVSPPPLPPTLSLLSFVKAKRQECLKAQILGGQGLNLG